MALDYQQLLEQALTKKGVNTPSVSSVSKVTKRFSEKNDDDDYREAWEERAAIMEFDGGLTRNAAQVQASVICLEWQRNVHGIRQDS